MRELSRSPRPVAALLAALMLLLSGCASSTPVSEPVAQAIIGAAPAADVSAVSVAADLVYDEATGQRLDICSPSTASASPRPAVLVVHGGSWARGGRADENWRPICQWLGSAGFVAVSVDYRLAPAAVFPAQIDDVAGALDWLLEPAQTERYGIDPERVGAFGGSAGGNLVSLLGTAEATSSRLSAVVDLSGPSDLTAAGLADDDPVAGVSAAVRTYLGCPDLAACPSAREASPLAQVDGSEPPFLIVHSARERVALSQSTRFADELRASGATAELLVQPGALHSIALLDDDLRTRVVTFLHAHLDAP
ncbi:alpha/beta hydrolase [Rathayibacter tanaceti]|uniref:Alpha/beta hydrolase fold domain-containing protein n=2 Tax=Rathayibacter tanaceti TaxID=1671680 RepID=A0A166HQB1_9MICO|nr:alpha/beta hydrolase [Rathayibacter tanaceti]KZX20994.1 Carboxylesterase NlhH [Rathayibacter tanaceti]QHC56405.1 alpha/beta hydrolase fold domain-containing protein [Rathayibacter tanaceti]TCO34934.1 acetyl esterase/lipase [Rathayibacter tanaceti]